GVPPPGDALGRAHGALRVTAAVQGVLGRTDGVYRVDGGEAVLERADPTAAAQLEQHYGYGLTPYNGCDIRHATAVWFFSVRPRDLVEGSGPHAWHDAQYACGWAAQGVCIAAAAAGLFARPVRAFHEVPTQRVLGLDPEEMLVLAVVTGAERHTAGVQLDLRF
ncbi:nitroreductase family protein, partial [Streptomonospora algeriensis]